MPGPGKNKHKNKKKDKRTPNRQLGSRFMQLPPELRGEIYSHLFLSTRLMWGERAFGRTARQSIRSVSNALTLLRTCRRVNGEIGTTWLQQVLFSFESPEAMLDKLANIPTATRALIRHARVSGDPLMLSWEDDSVYYRTSQMLKLLPGLALDRLTILASRVPEVRYHTLDMLVRHGTGWKELYYLSHDSAFLAYADDDFMYERRYLRVPQPAGWQRVLEKRDGVRSGASVEIYRATSRRPCSVLLEPATRAVLVQTLAAGQDLTTYGDQEDISLMAAGERDKEVLVVVRRGQGVDYAEKEGSPYLEDGDIREDKQAQTWNQIKAEEDRLLHYDDDDDFLADYEEEEEQPLVERYDHVDEYVWPPLHFQ
ncbi:hypothetical protein MVEN_02288700 [Mycena venus]|uniref:Uncharacterized protein n=1 Tax=Mycena venus TaxID=2733690 RepID=A0A8H7CGG9_9AGAR|nr:hypothetical protein MVEN_02288700 [Mycena venus]